MSTAAERLETVARAIWEADPDVQPDGPWSLIDYDPETYRPMAAAAIAAMSTSPAEEAVKRVEALADNWQRRLDALEEDELSNEAYALTLRELRAALASPAPAPHETWTYQTTEVPVPLDKGTGMGEGVQ